MSSMDLLEIQPPVRRKSLVPMTAKQDQDAEFERTVAEWDRRLEQAGEALDAAAPAPRVWDSIAARVDHLEAAHSSLTIAATLGVWEFSSPGVYRKLLHVDAAAGWQSFLLKVEPGAEIPPHAHPILEECLVLEGAFDVGGQTVRKGDLHLGFAGQGHDVIASPGGALLYVRGAVDG
jgi:anti-sigma factor ChrR (cupin superfamily)